MKVTVSVIQFSMSRYPEENILTAERMVRNAAASGANVIVLPELFEHRYFCQEMNSKYFDLAEEFDESYVVEKFSNVARELDVVIVVPFFEKDGALYYNSAAVVDADGSIAGKYRKTHVPLSACYHEKYYFTPSSNDYQVFDTYFGKIGILICWDQWFVEAVRALALQGVDLVVMPTAIGSEPDYPNGESYLHWARTIQGHSAANGVPIAVANRIGRERFGCTKIDFFGGSFITDNKGSVVAQIGGDLQLNGGVDPDPVEMKGHTQYTFDTVENERFRASWGLFRDRRPELYASLFVDN